MAEVSPAKLVFAEDEESICDSTSHSSVSGRKYILICGFKVKESRYVLALFLGLNILLYADQNLLAPNLSTIAEEFNMTDDERDVYLGGYISIGFFAVGGTISLVVGYLADTINRKWTFAAIVVLGELSCMMTYWVPAGTKEEFWYGLWLTRTLTGIALGGAVPLQMSLFGDYFGQKERGRAYAFLQIALGVGAGVGQFLAGYMTPDWRTPFLIVSIPAFALVAIFLVTTSEPERGGMEEVYNEYGEKVVNNESITWEKFKNIYKKPTPVLVSLQGIFGILPWGVALVFLNDFLNEEKNLDPKDSANIILVWGLGITSSIVLGGILVDRWIVDHKKRLPILAGVTTILATFPFLSVVLLRPLSPGYYMLILFPAGFIAGFGGVIVGPLLIHTTIPETRGSAFAIKSLVDEIGRGIGPFFVSKLIVAAGNRTKGLAIATTMWIPCGIVMLAIMFFLSNDIEKTEAEILLISKSKPSKEEAI
mmetsp:Transcript_13441/g.17508  ORF Transcript_13441/g.17508 Transcript_13441/m.17508 type:complete len:480 (-) Transcript_13441:840-2279(-)